MKNIRCIVLLILLNGYYNLTNSQITAQWKLTGPVKFPANNTPQINGIGRISQLVFHPSDSNKIYAVSASGGLFLSKDGAQSWNATGTDKLLDISCASVCVDHTNDKILYLGSGDANYYYKSSGVWKSTDGGATWNQSSTGMSNRLTVDLLMDPADNKVLLAATNNGILKSTDAGATWTVKKTGGEFQQMIFKPKDPKTLYAVTVTEFFRSTDMGETWTSVSFPGPAIAGGRLGVSPADPTILYVTFVGDFANGESTPVYRSADAGLTFKIVKPANTTNLNGYSESQKGQGRYNYAMTVDPLNANNVWVAGHCVWNSKDGGITWKRLTSWPKGIHTDMHHLVYSPHNPKKLFNANDGGVWMITETPTGISWKIMSDGLSCTENYHAGQNPLDKNKMGTGTQDNGIISYTGGNWITTKGGDYYETFACDYNGKTYHPSAGTQGVPLPYTANTSNIMEFTPLKKDVAFITDTEIWRTDSVQSASRTWLQISNFNSKVRALCISPVNANVVYAVTADGRVFRSDNALDDSVSFKNVSTAPAGTSSKANIAVIKSAPAVVYMSCGNTIYRSGDKGATWINASAGLPSLNISKIHHDIYSKDESMYIAVGPASVYYKNKNLTSWVNYSHGLPTITNIRDFMIYNDGNYANSVLRVAYYGRGVWETPLYNSSVTPITETTNEGNNALTVFPNPSKESVNISFIIPETAPAELAICDALGKVVKVIVDIKKLNPGEYNHTIDISALKPGAYVCKLNVNGVVKSKVLVKE